jgi:hypothetical protein
MKIGSKVRPNGWTKNALTYGYVRQIGTFSDPTEIVVYWPEIKSAGVWPRKDLALK